jgi:hypothetical protein
MERKQQTGADQQINGAQRPVRMAVGIIRHVD